MIHKTLAEAEMEMREIGDRDWWLSPKAIQTQAGWRVTITEKHTLLRVWAS